MKTRLLSIFLVAALVALAYGQNDKPERPKSYPISLKADEVREFAPLKIDHGGLRILSEGVSGIPISCEAGITGAMLIGNGTFRFAPEDGGAIEGHFRAAMLRFNPKQLDGILPLEELPATTDRAVEEISNRLLKESFRRCWHSGSEALIPDEGSFAVVVYSREHGELLISVSKKSSVVYSFSDRKKLYETAAR